MELEAYINSLSNQLSSRLDELPHTDPRRESLNFDEHQRVCNRNLLIGIQEGRRALSVVLPCGAGKTEVELNLLGASQLAKQQLRASDQQRDVLLTTEVTIADGIHQRAQSYGLDTGRWFGGVRELDRPIIIATIQSLVLNNTLRSLRRLLPENSIDMYIADEADLALTENRRNLRSRINPKISAAFTATPQLADGRTIEDDDDYGPAVQRMTPREGILAGINAMPNLFFYQAEIPEEELRIGADQDYDHRTLVAAWKHAELHLAIPQVYQQIVTEDLQRSTPTLIYVPSVAMVDATVDTLRGLIGPGVNVVGLAGRANSAVITDVREDFLNGNVQILVMCERGGRGMNLENARLLIDAYPTLSLNKLTQRHGRVLRRIREGSELWNRGERKEEAVIAQIVPRSLRRVRRPALAIDYLGGLQQFLQLREHRGGRSGGPPEEDPVDALRRNIEANNRVHNLELIREIGALEAIHRFDQILQEDERGFFRIPPRYEDPSIA